MRSQKTILMMLVFGLLSMSGNAVSQIDPYPDSVGIYFDEAATENSQYSTAPTTVHAYLIATRVSLSAGIDSWGGGVLCTIPICSELRGGGINAQVNGTDFSQQFDVSFPTPLPISSAIVLAALFISILDEEPITLYLEPLYGNDWVSVFCSSGTQQIALQPSVRCNNLPCYPAWVATINAAGPVMSDKKNWGAVKSLYR